MTYTRFIFILSSAISLIILNTRSLIYAPEYSKEFFVIIGLSLAIAGSAVVECLRISLKKDNVER